MWIKDPETSDPKRPDPQHCLKPRILVRNAHIYFNLLKQRKGTVEIILIVNLMPKAHFYSKIKGKTVEFEK